MTAPARIAVDTDDLIDRDRELLAPELAAAELANATDYGLSASVWSRDVDIAVGVGWGVRAGTIWINTFMDGASELPFGRGAAAHLGATP